MDYHIENNFKSKFCLLNTQQSSEEIIWSSSDYSDYENASGNGKFIKCNKSINRKRKRLKTKENDLKNTFDLNMYCIKSPLEHKSKIPAIHKSPIKRHLSPILLSSPRGFVPVNSRIEPSSPILPLNISGSKENSSKSPILAFNIKGECTKLPKISPNVRKKLFTNRSDNKVRSKSPILYSSQVDKVSKERHLYIKNVYTINNSVVQGNKEITKSSLNNKCSRKTKVVTLEEEIFGNKDIEGVNLLINNTDNMNVLNKVRSKSPILNSSQIDTGFKDSSLFCIKNVLTNKNIKEINELNLSYKTSSRCKEIILNKNENIDRLKTEGIKQIKKSSFNYKDTSKIEKVMEENLDIEFIKTSEECCNDTVSSIANIALMEKVKSYFDSHFSSETPSQQSISEYDTTPKDNSKTSEEIEIHSLTPKLEKKSPTNSPQRNESDSNEITKKVKYKKGGLAHRLNMLLKKRNASTSLWQHERYLVANSNFKVPVDGNTVFRILNVVFKNGCHLLDLIDVDNKKYIALINHLYMRCTLIDDMNIFKLYKPYNILDYKKDYKLILNITRFEFSKS